MTNRWDYRLEGLEPDNLLAFLALIGLLRAIQEARPEWVPRAGWDIPSPPWRPVLSLRSNVSETEISEAAVEGCRRLADALNFEDRKAIDFSEQEARTALTSDDPLARATMECLLTTVGYDKDTRPDPTPFCMMFGQGHQHFLSRFSGISQLESPDRGGGRNAVAVSPSTSISEALFMPWRRIDSTDSFRWDPAEANQRAYRARNPSNDPSAKTTEHGANRLAVIGLPLFPTLAKHVRGRTRILTRGSNLNERGRIVFRWPIWQPPTTLSGILALLQLSPARWPNGTKGISPEGIAAVMEAERISLGKFMNVVPAIVVNAH